MEKLRASSTELSSIVLRSPRYPEPGPLRKLPMARRSTPLLTLPFTSRASLAPGVASSMPPDAASPAGGSPDSFPLGAFPLDAFKSARWKPGRAFSAAAAAAAFADLDPFFAGGVAAAGPAARAEAAAV